MSRSRPRDDYRIRPPEWSTGPAFTGAIAASCWLANTELLTRRGSAQPPAKPSGREVDVLVPSDRGGPVLVPDDGKQRIS